MSSSRPPPPRVEKNKFRVGPYVRYEDETTSEYLYRPYTPEDGVLPGDRKAIQGRLVKPNSSPPSLLIETKDDTLDALELMAPFEGQYVEITINVLPRPAPEKASTP